MKKQKNNSEVDKQLLDEINKEFGVLNGLRRKTIKQIYALGEKLDAYCRHVETGVFEKTIEENQWGRTSVYDYKKFYGDVNKAAGQDNPLEFLDRFESYEQAKRKLRLSKTPLSDLGKPHSLTNSIGNGDDDVTPFDVTPRVDSEVKDSNPSTPIGVSEITPRTVGLPEQKQEPTDAFCHSVGQLLNLIRHAKVENKFKALKTLSELSMEIDLLADQLTSEMVAA